MDKVVKVFSQQTETKTYNQAIYGAKWLLGAAAAAALLHKFPLGIKSTTALSTACAAPTITVVASEEILGENHKVTEKIGSIMDLSVPFVYGLIGGAQLALTGAALKSCYQGAFRTLSWAGKCTVVTGLLVSSLELGWIKGIVIWEQQPGA